MEKIRPIALCLFQNKGRILASKGFDRTKNENFYRLLGGSIDFFETSQSCIRREIKEELQSEIENLKFLFVFENLFTYESTRGHEIVFLYSGDLAKQELYNQKSIRIAENTYELEAEWVSVEDIIAGKIILYPVLDYQSLLRKL
ncbi:MAG: NUDIX hydrolase [Patescibacteria group bacterium]